MQIIAQVLNSFSQLFFQSNAILGAIIVVSYGVFSPIGLGLALVGAVATNVTATLLGLPKEIIGDGVAGFNGVLVGAALAYFVKDIPSALIITLVLSILCAVFSILFYKTNIPPLAAPFVMSIWVFLLLSKYLK